MNPMSERYIDRHITLPKHLNDQTRKVFGRTIYRRRGTSFSRFTRRPWTSRSRFPRPAPSPSYPALYVLPKPGGTTRLPRSLLIKPDCTFNEIIQGLLGDGKPFRAEMIAQKIKSSLGPAYQGLMLGYLYYS